MRNQPVRVCINGFDGLAGHHIIGTSVCVAIVAAYVTLVSEIPAPEIVSVRLPPVRPIIAVDRKSSIPSVVSKPGIPMVVPGWVSEIWIPVEILGYSVWGPIREPGDRILACQIFYWIVRCRWIKVFLGFDPWRCR